VRARIEEEVAAVLAAGAVPFVLGGDHSVALPCLRAVAKKHGPLAVVHVDAHADTSGPQNWGPHHHGTPLREALDEKLIAEGQLHQLGLRGPWGSSEEGLYTLVHGGRVFSVEDLMDRGVADVLEEITDAIGDHPTYLTFDIDAVDPAFAPGTGTPVPGGLTSREALQIVRSLVGLKLVGMDLVEVSPPLDFSDLTSHLAAHLLYEGLALLAVD
jgi:agmatinase